MNKLLLKIYGYLTGYFYTKYLNQYRKLDNDMDWTNFKFTGEEDYESPKQIKGVRYGFATGNLPSVYVGDRR